MHVQHLHVLPASVCPTSMCMIDQSGGEVDQLARGGLSQDSQKQLQQDTRESLILPTNGGFCYILNVFCNLNVINIIKYPDSRGYQMYDPKPINIWLMGLEKGLLFFLRLLGNFGSEFSRERKCLYLKEFLYSCNLY